MCFTDVRARARSERGVKSARPSSSLTQAELIKTSERERETPQINLGLNDFTVLRGVCAGAYIHYREWTKGKVHVYNVTQNQTKTTYV